MKVKLARVIHEEIQTAFVEIALKTFPQTLSKFMFTVKYLFLSQDEQKREVINYLRNSPHPS